MHVDVKQEYGNVWRLPRVSKNVPVLETNFHRQIVISVIACRGEDLVSRQVLFAQTKL